VTTPPTASSTVAHRVSTPGPEQRDTEDQATGQVPHALDADDDPEGADVPLGAAAGRDREDVVHVGRAGVGDRRQHPCRDGRGHHDAEVPGGQQQVSDEPEDPVASDLVEVHPGDAEQRQRRHHDLRTVADDDLGRSDRVDVHGWMPDLDPDEEGARGGRGDAGGPGQGGGGDGQGPAPVRGPGGRRGASGP
jgi:hypothetical protein